MTTLGTLQERSRRAARRAAGLAGWLCIAAALPLGDLPFAAPRPGAAGPGVLRLGPQRVNAQRVNAPTLDAQSRDPLASLVAEALRNNAGLEAEQLAEARSAADVREARSRYLPSVAVESRYSRQRGTVDLGDAVNPAYAALNELTGSDRFPTDLDLTLPLRHESRLRLTQPLFNEAIRGNHALARHRHDAQRHQRLAAARRLAAQVQAAYLDGASARAAVRILESSLCLVEENERVATRLVDAGRATPDVLFRARAERSDVAQQLTEAEERARAAARVLNQLVGRPLDAPVEELPDSAFLREIDLTEREAVTHALARREELAQLQAGVRSAQAGERIVGASFLPSMALALDYGYQGGELRFGRDEDFLVGSVVLSWNVFSGGGDVARRQAARSETERIRARAAEAESLIRLDVRQAYEGAVVARSAIGNAEDRLLAARRTFELVRRRYDEGVASHIEFVDARTALTNAAINHSLTLYRYAARLVDLERAAALRAID